MLAQIYLKPYFTLLERSVEMVFVQAELHYKRVTAEIKVIIEVS